ncbi:MAG: hypothetical protein HYX80_02495 [Chloroflexi bacterium]|nr:hypothetical protein [Chloroflexota bacterium]
MKIRHLTAEDLTKLLKEYEAKYGMDTPTFAVKYNRGELPEDIEYMEWISYYDMAAKVGLIKKRKTV